MYKVSSSPGAAAAAAPHPLKTSPTSTPNKLPSNIYHAHFLIFQSTNECENL